MKKIVKNQKAAAILAETDLQNVGGAGCPACGLVLAFDPSIYLNPVLFGGIDPNVIKGIGGLGGGL
jgi:hypothetical protein